MNFKQFFESFEPKILYVVRGLPKSGCTTKANELLTKKGGSPDHIFNTTQISVKDGKGLLSGHSSKFQAFKYAVDNGYTPIILDGNHYQWAALSAYVKYADKAEYEIKLEEPSWKEWGKHRQFLKDKNEEQLKKLVDVLHRNGASVTSVQTAIKQWQEISLKEKLKPKKGKK
jgi:predicted house-cleaning noncanonical NTP pyrophosphatase (MazG superfamily)